MKTKTTPKKKPNDACACKAGPPSWSQVFLAVFFGLAFLAGDHPFIAAFVVLTLGSEGWE